MATIISNDTIVNSTENDDSTSYIILDIVLSSIVRFWIILISEILSLICSLVLLYYLCFDRTLRQALSNHVLIVLIILGIFSQAADVSNYLTYLRLGYVWPQTPINCYMWWFIGSMSYNGIGMLMAWASIERHILVFHHRWFNTQKKRIFTHYIPIITIVIYLCIFYAVCIFFVSCENTPYYTVNWCGLPCVYGMINIVLFDLFFNGVLPSVLIIIFNILLFIRVIKQKHRLHQHIQWYKYRRMIIQLASCSTLFLLFQLPLVFLTIAHVFGVPYGSTGQFELFIYFMGYFIVLWMPFVCLGSSPEIWLKMKGMMEIPCFINRVVPQISHTVR